MIASTSSPDPWTRDNERDSCTRIVKTAKGTSCLLEVTFEEIAKHGMRLEDGCLLGNTGGEVMVRVTLLNPEPPPPVSPLFGPYGATLDLVERLVKGTR